MKKILAFYMIIVLVFSLFLVRLASPRWLDDISPGIPCDEELIKKSDVLFVIPKFDNRSISDNKTWCDDIKKMNKTLAMHGVYHTYNEFLLDRDEHYLQEGIDAFQGCFGFLPNEFKPPQMALSDKNKILIENRLRLNYYLEDILHKTYHCNDTGIFPNFLVDLF